MTSHAPKQCCAIGVKHEGEPTGSSITVNGFDAYLAKASGNNAHAGTCIIFLPDVIGIWQNSQLMADQFAANGYTTIIPDYFNKDPVKLNPPEGFQIMEWLTKGTGGNNPHTTKEVDPVVEQTIQYMKDQGYNKLGAVGYCFGGKYVARFLAKGRGLSVGYVAHPSFVEADELKAITGPFSIAAADTDQIFPAEKRHESEDILKETGLPYQVSLYGGVSHGFAVRGDLNVKVAKYAKEQAFLQAVTWFDEHLL